MSKKITDMGGLSKLKKLVNNDGWMNVFTGLGIKNKDKDTGAGISQPNRFTEHEQDSIYRSDGIAARVVDLPVEDMLRKGFEVTNDTDGDIVNYLNTNLDLTKQLELALRWQDVFGASVVVMTINDGGEFDEPLNVNNIKEIEELNVYDRWRISHSSIDVQSNPAERNYGELEYIDISPLKGGTNSRFKVHTSRVLWFNNRMRTMLSFRENDRFGDSLYTNIWKQLYRLDKGYDSSAKILDDFVTSIYSISGLQQMIASGNEQQIINRANTMDLTRSIANSVFMDEKESYNKVSSSITNLPQLMEKFEIQVASVVGIPLTLLMQMPPGSMGNSEDPSIRNWYDRISSRQIKELLTPLNYLTELVMLSKMGPTKGRIIDDWSIKFNPLWQLTEEQIAEQRKKVAETDSVYINNQVVSPQEIRESRFGGVEYSAETTISEEDSPDSMIEERTKLLEEENTTLKAQMEDANNKNANNDSSIRRDGYIGVTTVNNEHHHEFFKDEQGNGATSPSLVDGHVHPIINGVMQEVNNHIHEPAIKEKVIRGTILFEGTTEFVQTDVVDKSILGANSTLQSGELLNQPKGSPHGQTAN